MTPITPDLHKTPIFKTQLPTRWMPAYEYLVRLSATRSEIAAFPTLFVAAYNGNEDALRKVMELVFVSYYAAKNYAKTQEEIDTANAIMYLGNKLAEHVQAEKAKEESDAGAAALKPTSKPEPTPVKPEAKQPKPVIDPKIQFVKPGSFRSEK
jgi:hypothetical protein